MVVPSSTISFADEEYGNENVVVCGNNERGTSVMWMMWRLRLQ
jgi:hypothetical protein